MKFGSNRLLTALRLALYPALEPAAAKRFEAFTREVRNTREAGDLAGAEQLYLRAMAEARDSSDPTQLNFLRYGLAEVYQEQKKYPEAELLLRERLEESLKAAQPNTEVHAAHMHLARFYQEQGKLAQAEEHYKSALAETEKPGVWPDRELLSSTALWLGRFYVERQRYRDAEPLFRRFVETREASRPSDPSLPHYLPELAKIYEALEEYAAAEELYRRALKIAEELDEPKDFLIVRALDELAQFCQSRGRYSEAEDHSRRSLSLVEEKIQAQTIADIKRHSRWSKNSDADARVKRARIPISEALDRLAVIYELREKYAESEPLRRRSIEIKEQAWGEANARIWVDSLAAHAKALHKLGRDDEAARLDERVGAIRAQYPGGYRAYARLIARPMKRTLRGRFRIFMNALLHPSPR